MRNRSSSERAAIRGGLPVRDKKTDLRYSRQTIGQQDLVSVSTALISDMLGSTVSEFEGVFARETKMMYVVALNSGTAALHTAMAILDIKPGDQVIVPAITFANVVNAVLYQGGMPVFADVDPETLLVDPSSVADLLSSRVKAVVVSDFAGQVHDHERLGQAVDGWVPIVVDAADSLGVAESGGEMFCYSFHPTKSITTGEGGMLAFPQDISQQRNWYSKALAFRNYGRLTGTEDVSILGYDYRMSDMAAALGMSQFNRLPEFIKRRQEIASMYDTVLAPFSSVLGPIIDKSGGNHSYHLYVISLTSQDLRDKVLDGLRREGILAEVHYPPVYLHSYYQERFNLGPGICPNAEKASGEIMSLPIFPGMENEDVEDVVEAIHRVLEASE